MKRRMKRRMKRLASIKRLFAFLLIASMSFGELGSINVSAQEPVISGVQEIENSNKLEDDQQNPPITEENPFENPDLGEETEPSEDDEEPKGDDLTEDEEGFEKDDTTEDGEKPEDDITEDEDIAEDEEEPGEDDLIENDEELLAGPGAAEVLEAPTKLALTVDSRSEGGGEVNLSWYYNISYDDTSYSFEIYRSETEDGEYEKMTEDFWSADDDAHLFATYVPIGALNPETGNARKYYFKVKAVHTTELDGASTITESDFSEPVCNAEIVQGSGMDTSYNGICLLYDGNPVSKLELHVGETKRVGLGLIKTDGTVVAMKTLHSQLQNAVYTDLDWGTSFVSGSETAWWEDWDREDAAEYVDIEFSMEDDVLYGYEQYITAKQLLKSDETENYFLQIETQSNSVFGYYTFRVPVTILEAEEGVTYEKGFTPVYICRSKAEAYAQAREIQRNRSKGTILVEEGVFDQSDIYRMFNPEEVFDTYAERDGMKPDEGDYIFYHIGDLSKTAGEVVMIEDYEYKYLKAGNTYYDAYTFSGPYLTTREQEDRVDAEIQRLLSPGGELHNVSISGTQTAKAEAIASYVKGHVSYIGSTDPKYHTCYSALIDQRGTCEAYSLLFMRLAREMGLASKMVGTTLDADGNCHDFNIVQVDGKWYHIDALGDCKLHTGRPGATLAPVYLDQRFINNYLSKIPGSDYQYESNGLVTIEDDLGEREEFTSLSDAKDRVKVLAAEDGNQDRTYRVTINKDMKPDGREALDFGEAADRVTIDLCGHTLQIIDMSGLYIRAARVTNGKITVGSEAMLGIYPLQESKSVYDNLSISWKQTESGIGYGETRWAIMTTNDYPTDANLGTICLEDTVKIGSNLYDLNLSCGVEMKGNVTAKSMNFADGVRISGNVTTDELWISGDYDEDLGRYVSNVFLDGVVNVKKKLNVMSDLTVTGNWNVSGWSGFGTTTPIIVTIEDSASLSLSGKTAAFVDNGGYYGNYEGPAVVRIVRKYDEQGSLISQGKFSVSGTLQLPGASQIIPADRPERTVFDIRPEDYVNDVLQENAVFHSGDTLATLSINKILDGDGTIAAAGLNDTNLGTYITSGAIDSEKGSLELDETTLLVSSDCVQVSYYEEGDTENPKETATYSSLKKAVENLDNLAGKAKGNYTFTFLDNGTFTKALTLPNYVSYALFKSESEEYQLDFRGYTLTMPGDMAVEDSLRMISSGGVAGTIVLNKSNVKTGVADTEDEIPTFTFITGKGSVQTLLKDVNITAKNTAVTLSAEREGATTETDAFTLEGTISAHTLYVKSGNWNLGKASLTTLQIDPESDLKISELTSVVDLKVGEHAKIRANKMTQSSKGKVNLAPGSIMAVYEKAVLYNPVLTVGEEDAHLYFAPDAALEIHGKVTRNAEAYLSMGMLDEGSDMLQCVDFNGEKKLFTTKITNFPVEALHIEQRVENYNQVYNKAYQIGDGVYVGAEWFTVYAQNVNGEKTKIATFTKWSEMAAYVDTLSNASMTYIVEILEDVDTKSALTMPIKAKSIVFCSARANERITLKAVGDVKLSTDISFESVDLELTKYDKKTNKNIPAVVTLSGRAMRLKNSNVSVGSIVGTNVSALEVQDGEVEVTGAVTNLGKLNLYNASFTAGGAIAVTDTLTMESAALESSSKITLKNLVSNDNRNTITYGGNAKTNILTISGTVTSSRYEEDGEQSVGIVGTGETAIIRNAAISLNPRAAVADKNGEILLCNAAKAGEGWFVVGRLPDMGTIESAAYKSGNDIYKGGSLKAVRLKSGTVSDTGAVTYCFEGSFATLQEAFSEIDRMAENKKSYRIEVDTENPEEVTFSNKTLTFPSKTAGVTIEFVNTDEPVALYCKGTMTLKSNLELVNAMIAPEGRMAIALGKFSLTLDHCGTSEIGAVSQITGSGVAGPSQLNLKGVNLTVMGKVDKVGRLRLNNAVLWSWAAMNLGSVSAGGGETEIAATAKVTRDKEGKITKIEPQISIAGTVDVPESGRFEGWALGLRLLEKATDGSYESIDFSYEDSEGILTQGVSMAKAPLADSSVVIPQNEGLTDGSDPLTIVKSNGYLTCYKSGRYGAVLIYQAEESGQDQFIYCRTFGDAVTEINSYKVKRDYIIQVTGNAQGIAQDNPKALTMPDKRYIASLRIMGENISEEATVLPYTGNITFTSDTTLGNIYFKQRVKVSGAYQDAVEAANAVTVSTGGYALDIEGNVLFNTPLTLTGGNKGTLTLKDSGCLQTWTNGYTGEESGDSVLYGTISGFNKVTVSNENLVMREYRKNATEVNPSKAASVTVTDMELSNGSFTLVGDYAKGSVTVKNLAVSGGNVTVGGKLSLTNVEIQNAGGSPVSIRADQNFTISGKLNNQAETSVTLYTRLQGKGKAPYLAVNGGVESQFPIQVCVLAELASENPDAPVELKDAPKATGQLLTAKTASASAFYPAPANYTNGLGEYSAENPNGYMMVKSGTGIYVYDGSHVQVALCKGNYSVSEYSLANLENAANAGALLGYYTDLKTASAAVDALKDSSAEYTFILTKDMGTVEAPVAVTLPSRAKSVFVTSLRGNVNAQKNLAIVFNGNIALKCATVFDNIYFAPVNKKDGASYGFSAGGFDLTLRDVGIMDQNSSDHPELVEQISQMAHPEAMAFQNISGNGKQTITLASDSLVLNGGITNAKTLKVARDTEIRGNIKASVLEMDSDRNISVTFIAGGAVTIDTVKGGSYGSELKYTRNAKGATNLTINKQIEGYPYPKLNMIVPEQDISAFRLEMDEAAGNVMLTDSLKLAVMPMASTNSFEQQINGVQVSSDEDGGRIVKANKGTYLVAPKLAEQGVALHINNARLSYCLDYQQAVNEINNLSDSMGNYMIQFESNTNDIDTNLTDKTPYSAFALPAQNKAASVIVECAEEMERTISFTNDLSGTGNVSLANLVLNPVDAKGNPKTCKISITKDKTPETSLHLTNVETADPAVARLSQITGTRNATNVVIEGSDLLLTTGFSNIGDLTLTDARITCGGSSAIRELSLVNSASFAVLGKTTLETIDVSQANNNQADPAYIGARLVKGNPVLTLNGQVRSEKGNPIVCKVYTEESTISNSVEVASYMGENGDVPLIMAKKAPASSFRAEPYAYGNQGVEVIAYKDGSYVKNGNSGNMAVRICSVDNETGAEIGTTYARSFDEAVIDINNMANASIRYELTLLTKEDRQVRTTKKGTAFGTLTLPSKAASILIKSEDSVNPMILTYTGTMKTSCNVTFQDVLLTEGTVKKGVYIPSYQITPTPGTNATITFEASARTLASGQTAGAEHLMMTSVSGNKGGLELRGGTVAEVKGAVTLAELVLSEASQMEIDGKVTITDLYVGNNGNTVQAAQAVAITNIYNYGGECRLIINTCLTKIRKEGQFGNTQLAINGEIQDVDVELRLNLYDLSTGEYRPMGAGDFEPLWFSGSGKPAAYQKIVTMPKAGNEQVGLPVIDEIPGARLVKYESGLYVTNREAVVRVTGTRDDRYVDDSCVYQADFLDWNQAVKEIDRIANVNNSYTIELLGTVGVIDEEITPVATVNMPAKAKEVTISSSVDEARGIFFTGAAITLKCPVIMNNIALVRVSRNSKTKLYEVVPHTINVGNFAFSLTNQRDNLYGMRAMAGNISGTAKGSFTFGTDRGNTLNDPALKITNVGEVNLQGVYSGAVNQKVERVENGITGVSTLNLENGVQVKSGAEVSVKNLVMNNSVLEAKNISVSIQTDLFNRSELRAGTKTVGDGKITLNNVRVQDEGNGLLAKQDKSGNTQITINGTITGGSPIRVGLYYNNQSSFAQLYGGMALCNAKNAAVSEEMLIPYYTGADGSAGMGLEESNYVVRKNKNVIYYVSL